MSSPNIQELYESYDIISNKEIETEKKKNAYEKIMKAVAGDEKEKRLASQFIVAFFDMFPDLYEEAFNKLLDLCEEENITIRKQVIHLLPTVAKKVADYLPKTADTLTQMLMTDDSTEISMINAALNTILNIDLKTGLEAIFNQLLTQLDEAADIMNTYAYKYLYDKFASMTEVSAEIDSLIEANGNKLLEKLSGKDEFHLVISMLSCLKTNSTVIGRQKLVSQLSEKTKLIGPVNDTKKLYILLLNAREAVKLLSKNVHADDILMLLLENMVNIQQLSLDESEFKMCHVLQCLVDLTIRGCNIETNSLVSKLDFSTDEALKHLKTLYEICVSKIPQVPEEVKEEDINKLSEDTDMLIDIERSLLALYYLCKHRPEVVVQDDKFRSRLQYLGRIVQAAHKRASENVAKLTSAQKSLEDNKCVLAFPRTTGNLQVLVREFFKFPPSFKVVITPSWVPVGTPEVGQKRPGASTNTQVDKKKQNRFPPRFGGRGYRKNRFNNGSGGGFRRRN